MNPIERYSVQMSIHDEAFQRLVADKHHPKATLMIPGREPGHSPAEDETRLRNMVRAAIRELVAGGMDEKNANSWFEGLVEYVDHKGPDSARSRAIFLSEGQRTILTLPMDLGEQIVIDDEFALSQLASMVRPMRFAMIALTRNGASAAVATRFGWVELDLPDAPDGLAEVTQYSDTERQLQSHRVGGGQAFHGHGTADNKESEDLHKYATMVASAVERAAPDVRKHVTFGEPSLVAEYRQTVGNGAIEVIAMSSNPSDESFDELHNRALAEIGQVLDTAKGAIAAYDRLAGTDKGSTDLAEIVPAAKAGKVESLVLGPRVGDGEVERAVHETWVHGGSVYRTDNIEGVAAVLRY
jgi:hypothetical protein